MLRVYDTRSRRVQPVGGTHRGELRMYTCGPTVYRYAHVGNLRSYLLSDLIRRGAERREEVPHHHSVEPRLDGERLQLAEVLDPSAAEPEERAREDQAHDAARVDDGALTRRCEDRESIGRGDFAKSLILAMRMPKEFAMLPPPQQPRN